MILKMFSFRFADRKKFRFPVLKPETFSGSLLLHNGFLFSGIMETLVVAEFLENTLMVDPKMIQYRLEQPLEAGTPIYILYANIK